jgi:hypothetical protein
MQSFITKTGELDIYRLISNKYEQQPPDENNRYWIEEISLFLGVWRGKKAEMTAFWLRWWDQSGKLLLWGSERVEQERQRTDQERERAEHAELLLQQERRRADELVQRLRDLGVNPEQVSS